METTHDLDNYKASASEKNVLPWTSTPHVDYARTNCDRNVRKSEPIPRTERAGRWSMTNRDLRSLPRCGSAWCALERGIGLSEPKPCLLAFDIEQAELHQSIALFESEYGRRRGLFKLVEACQ